MRPGETRSHRLICEKCSQPFLVKPRYRDAARFCSRQCHGAAVAAKSLAARVEENSMPVTECGCWIWMLSSARFGHGQLTFRYEHLAAHRASWMAFRGPIPEGMHVLHTCDIPQCVNPDHLYLGKDLENARDRMERGRATLPPRNIGDDHPNAKITAETAREIKYATGTAKEISERTGVHYQTVHSIRAGRNWSHI